MNFNLKKKFTTITSSQAKVPPRFDEIIENLNGIILKEEPKWIEVILKYYFPCSFACCGCCLNLDPFYRVGALPEGKHALKKIGDPHGWRPSFSDLRATNKIFMSDMSSNCCVDVCLGLFCCSRAAPYSLTLKHKTFTWPFVTFKKKFGFGGICCCPHSAKLTLNKNVVGRIKQDWTVLNYPKRCIESKLFCTEHYKIQARENNKWVDRYSILIGQGFRGPHINFCGASPFRNDILWEIKAPSKDIAGRIQKTYGGSKSIESFLRWCCLSADNYLLEWEEDTSIEDKAMFISTLLFLDSIYFDRTNPISKYFT